MSETIELVRGAILERKRLQHVALNVAKFVSLQQNPLLAADVANSDVIGIDGMGILWAARSLGLSAKERVAGIDLFYESLSLCAREGFRPYFLGATTSVVREAARLALERHPNLAMAGVSDGYFLPEEELKVVGDIRESGADCLFIGMPTPYKERFLAAHRDELNVPFVMGVGGSFDVLAKKVRRAPLIMQSTGLEWLYRLYQEPRRMWWRYSKTNALFLAILIRALVQRYIFGKRPPSHEAIKVGPL